MRLKGKVIIITGASDGIGKSTAIRLAQEGAQLIINARGIERLEQLKEEISQFGAPPLVIPADATLATTAQTIVATSLQHFDRIDGLINNIGGASTIKVFEEITEDDWEYMHNFNLKSVFLLCKQVIPIMKEQHYGRIVNLSSVAGRNKFQLVGLQYSSAKTGLLGFTRHLASEVASFGITVNAVAPGTVLTARVKKKWDALSAQEQKNILANTPINRLAEPEEVANAILFLISDEASYITGTTLDVNGGSVMT